MDQRPGNALLLQSRFGNAEFGYMYATKEENKNNGRLHSAAINYGINKAAIQVGLQQNTNTLYNLDSQPNNRVLAKTLSAYYIFNQTRIGVGYEHIRDQINIIDKMMTLSQGIAENKKIEIIYAQYNERSRNGIYGSAYEIELAYEYMLSKQTSIKCGAGIIQNSNTNINFGANWLPPPLPPGSDLRFVTTGIAHSF
jgi:predicted porin